MIRCAAFSTFLIFDLALALFIGKVAVGYVSERTWMSLDDRMTLLTPLAVIITGLFSTLWIFGRRSRTRIAPVTQWLLHSNIHALLMLLAIYLLTQYSLIAHDGTAYWGLMFVPCILFGVPLLIAALIIGGIADIVMSARRRRNAAGADN